MSAVITVHSNSVLALFETWEIKYIAAVMWVRECKGNGQWMIPGENLRRRLLNQANVLYKRK